MIIWCWLSMKLTYWYRQRTKSILRNVVATTTKCTFLKLSNFQIQMMSRWPVKRWWRRRSSSGKPPRQPNMLQHPKKGFREHCLSIVTHHGIAVLGKEILVDLTVLERWSSSDDPAMGFTDFLADVPNAVLLGFQQAVQRRVKNKAMKKLKRNKDTQILLTHPMCGR